MGGIVSPAGIPRRPEAQQELQAALINLELHLAEYKARKASDETEIVGDVVAQTIELCSTVPDTKESYGDFVLNINRLTRELFTVQNRLLHSMKSIKKNASSRTEL